MLDDKKKRLVDKTNLFDKKKRKKEFIRNKNLIKASRELFSDMQKFSDSWGQLLDCIPQRLCAYPSHVYQNMDPDSHHLVGQ